MIVKYQDDYWLYDGERNGELLILKHLSTGKIVEVAQKDVEIMKTKQQLADVAAVLRK
jgi:hypothetical protein